MLDHTQSLTLLSDLLDLARKNGANTADAVMSAYADLAVGCRLGKPETLERTESQGVGLRVFVGQQQAIVSGNDFSPPALKDLAERAVAMAKAAPADPFAGLAEKKLLANGNIPELDLFDNSEPTADTLMNLCLEAENAARAVPGITNSEGAEAHFGSGITALASTEGFAKSYASSSGSLSTTVIAGTGTGMERDYEYGVARHFSDLPSAQSIGKSAAERTLKRLGPRQVNTCSVPVVLDPRVARGLLHYIASAISGQSVARGTSFLKDKLNQMIFSSAVSIIDEPHRLRGLASKPYDGEGVIGKKRALIDKGILASWLLDSRSARQLKMETTGHASRGLSSPPAPSPTNLYMEAGTQSPEALMSDIKQGFYVTEAHGPGVNLITGDYSQGAAGFWIENGKIAYPVSEVTIAGHLSEIFLRMTPANDLEFRFAHNAPTVRIDSMMVGGQS